MEQIPAEETRVTAESQLVKHTFTVEVIMPAVSGYGWSKYPDYSADEIGYVIRRALDRDLDCESISAVTFIRTDKA